MNTQKIDFGHMSKSQDATAAQAVNAGKAWTEKDDAFLENHMFDYTIDELAIALGRTAYSVSTRLTKNAHFIELRKKAGDKPVEITRPKKVEEKNYFVSSDMDVLFGTGD